VHVIQLEAEVSQVEQEVEQAWQTELLAKNPVLQVDKHEVPYKTNPVEQLRQFVDVPEQVKHPVAHEVH